VVIAYLQKGQWNNAISLLNSIPSNNVLDEQQQPVQNDLVNYVATLNEIHEADTNFNGLTEQQKNSLTALADYSDNRIGSYARNILMGLGVYNYNEPILLPEGELKSSSAIQVMEPVLKSYPKVKLYPNPAKDYVIVEMLTGNIYGADVYLYDNLGKFAGNFIIPPKEQFALLQLTGIEPGVYILSVRYNGRLIGSGKLNLLK